MSWKPKLVKRLRELCAEGRSSGYIAAELGLTRNQIIGKASRLGLSLSYKGTGRPGAGRRIVIPPFLPRHQERARVARMAKLKPEPKPRERTPEPAPAPIELPTHADAPLPTSRPCVLVELTSTCCRWPLGDVRTPEFRFCAAPKEPERAYCPTHARMAVGSGTQGERSAVSAAIAVSAPERSAAA